MTRRFGTFAAALITIVTSLVAFTWAQAPAAGFEQFWSARYTSPSSGLTASAARRPNPPPDPGTSNAMHHWNQIAIDAGGLDHTPVADGESADLRRAARAGPLEPRHGDRPHRDVRRGQCDRQAATEATPVCPTHPPTLRWTPRSPRRRTTRWSRCSLAEGALRRAARRRARQRFRDGRAKSERHPPRQARRRGDPELQRQRRLAACRAACGVDFITERSARASGARIRSASCRWRSARIGARSGRSSCGSSTSFRVAAAAGDDQPRVHGGLQRGEAPRRRRRHHADRADRRSDA